MRKGFVFILLFFVFPIASYASEGANEEMVELVKEFLPPGAVFVHPETPASVGAIELYDFDKDGTKEWIVTYKRKQKESPSPSEYGVLLLKEEKNRLKKIWETSTEGVGLNYSNLADITNDGVKEYMFGVTIGASAGNMMEIFVWKDDSFQKVADFPYHMIELIEENNKVGIAVWERYIADTYFIDVLQWNGETFVQDEELYATYYPTIETFYYEKIANHNAWFYWYTLADAQIKANLLEKAKTSIDLGLALAKKLSLADVVENFHELKKRLEEKKTLL